MGTRTISALRIILVLALAGSLVVQTAIVPLLWHDLEGTENWVRTLFAAILVLGVLALQVSAVCIWQLLTLVRRGSVFSRAAFRYVDVIIRAIAAGAVLVFALAAMLAPGDVAPGIVGLICGAALVIAGVALLVVVLRMLLVQAVEREAEARELRSELKEVI